ncbi:hypothetical protein C8R42DRAFT_725784 [Lentinula raphanica]|nr:hypothetical protein C8R42DRAFT_725784 [Lentinula raphanica]
MDPEYDVATSARSLCFYKDEKFNPDSPDEGYLQSYLSLQVYRTIYMSLSSAKSQLEDVENLQPAKKNKAANSHRDHVANIIHMLLYSGVIQPSNPLFTMSHLEAITMTDLRYKYYTTFESLQGAVTSLSISADGKYLAATGVFGAVVWDLKYLTLPGVRARDEEKRLFSTSAWLCFDDGSGNTFRYVLILGCLNGDVTALDLNEEEMELQANRLPIAPSTAQQVVSLDVQQPEVGNRSHARVVASFADSIIKCWTLCLDGEFELVFSMTLEPSFLPKTVCFNKENQCVLVFSKRGGVCVLLDCSTGEVISRIENGCQLMAWVSVDQDTSRFIASTGYGFQLFDLNSLNYIRSFVQDGMDPENAFPCQVAFVENGSKIVGGTDQGEALLFDSHSGLLEQRMEFPTKKPVPAITTCTLKDRYYIAVAVGTSSGKTSAIAVMCKLRTQTPVYRSRFPLEKKADPVIFAVHKSSIIFLMYVLSGIIVLVVALLWRPAIANFTIYRPFFKISTSLARIYGEMLDTLKLQSSNVHEVVRATPLAEPFWENEMGLKR